MSKKETLFPYIVWSDGGYDGWYPTGYNTLDEALKHESYGAEKIITKPCFYKIQELEDK